MIRVRLYQRHSIEKINDIILKNESNASCWMVAQIHLIYLKNGIIKEELSGFGIWHCWLSKFLTFKFSGFKVICSCWILIFIHFFLTCYWVSILAQSSIKITPVASWNPFTGFALIRIFSVSIYPFYSFPGSWYVKHDWTPFRSCTCWGWWVLEVSYLRKAS